MAVTDRLVKREMSCQNESHAARVSGEGASRLDSSRLGGDLSRPGAESVRSTFASCLCMRSPKTAPCARMAAPYAASAARVAGKRP